MIGAGLVGTEFANDLSASGYKPIVVDLLAYPLAQLVPQRAGELVRDAMQAAGVEWRFGRKVTALNKAGAGLRATLDDGSTIDSDAVLSAVGLRPHTLVAEEAGLAVNRGIKVDATGRTSDPHIYAIGDCAEYPRGLAAYVSPIMSAARAIAASVLGTPTDMRFPTLSVQVKTTACPVILLPAPIGADGQWITESDDSEGLRTLFKDRNGTILGYVLTAARCAERTELDRIIGDMHHHKDAA